MAKCHIGFPANWYNESICLRRKKFDTCCQNISQTAFRSVLFYQTYSDNILSFDEFESACWEFESNVNVMHISNKNSHKYLLDFIEYFRKLQYHWECRIEIIAWRISKTCLRFNEFCQNTLNRWIRNQIHKILNE